MAWMALSLSFQVWVAMPAKGASVSRLIVESYRRGGRFGDRLRVVLSDFFTELPPEEGVGGGDGSFFDRTLGLFQLAMQATTE